MTAEQWRLLAEVIAGLQVPMSMPSPWQTLGAAHEPLLELRRSLGLVGWQTVEEIESALRREEP